MIWLTKPFENSPHMKAAIQNRFAVLFATQGSPESMLLVEENHAPHLSTIWLRLPDERLRSSFGELDEGDERHLPKSATLLIGHAGEFEKLFAYASG